MAFKEKYVNVQNQVIVPSDFDRQMAGFYSNKTGANGNGSYASPASTMPAINFPKNYYNAIISGGYHKDVVINCPTVNDGHQAIIGQGIFNTVIENLRQNGVGHPNLKDLSIGGECYARQRFYIRSCRMLPSFKAIFDTPNAYTITLVDSVVSVDFTPQTAGTNYTNVSFMEISEIPLSEIAKSLNALAENCNIYISVIGGNAANYLAFGKCNFKIGSETAFTALTGSNAEARKANFIARCEAQGISCPSVPDLGVTGKLQRWDFEDESIVGGAVIDGSTLAVKNAKRGFYMGYTKPIRTIPLTLDSTPNGNFTGSDAGLDFTDGEIFINESVDVNILNGMIMITGVIPLGSPTGIEAVDIIHTFSSKLGLHFRDLDRDEVRHMTIALRLANNIPPAYIRTGELHSSFYYLVEADTPEGKSGYIEYAGSKHYCGSSFYTSRDLGLNFVIPSEFVGKVHLRECWSSLFKNGENHLQISSDFWQYETLKPNKMQFVADDIRAQFVGDNENSGVIKPDTRGLYFTSGHPLFYEDILAGVPAFPISAAYVQIEIKALTGDEA